MVATGDSLRDILWLQMINTKLIEETIVWNISVIKIMIPTLACLFDAHDIAEKYLSCGNRPCFISKFVFCDFSVLIFTALHLLM